MPNYSKHTAHFNRAKIRTYNYKFIDDAIKTAYNQGYTRKQIAVALREPENRIIYRIQELIKENEIQPKRVTKKTLMRRRIQELETELANAKAELANA